MRLLILMIYRFNPIECSRKSLDEDGYYCNQELVQLLVFDAKVTNTSYGTWRFDSEGDKNLAAIYNANLRFVATMSGLTRWQFICGEIEVEDDKYEICNFSYAKVSIDCVYCREFGDYYTRAIDEPWYRSAVLQHRVDPESFVYSVPHDDPDDTKEEGDRKVTASHAVFRTDGGKKAPGCVVGFQFEHEKMQKRFDNITSRDNVRQILTELLFSIDSIRNPIFSFNFGLVRWLPERLWSFFCEVLRRR